MLTGSGLDRIAADLARLAGVAAQVGPAAAAKLNAANPGRVPIARAGAGSLTLSRPPRAPGWAAAVTEAADEAFAGKGG